MAMLRPLRRTLSPNHPPPRRSLSPHVVPILPPRRLCDHKLFEHQFHSSASEIESKAVSVIRAVLFGLYACLFLLALKDLAKYKAGSDSFTVQSTDITLARALNGSSVDSKDIDISKPALSFFPGAVEGQKVSIKFQIAATHYAAQLIANIASDLGLKIRSGGLHGKAFYFFPWRSRVSWELMLACSEKKKETGGEGRDLQIHVFRSVSPFSDRFEIEFVKDGSWSPKEVDALVSTCVTWCKDELLGN